MPQNSLPPSSFQRELSIRSESIQRIYNFYINELLYVNRRYQRKLVWKIEEKRAFIDSILQGFPVPIILLAETEKEGKSVYEIIDGMQRLNAITSFIEGEFDLNNHFFDLQTIVESKSLLDRGSLKQKEPILDRRQCETIGSYVVPLSVYSFNNEEKIDEIFRRINSNGKYLSRQELRSAGTTSSFANIVRVVASIIRTDASASDILLLNNMREISITNKQLEYGIKIDDIFWIQHKILTKDMLRESKDEEIITDIIAYMLLNNTPKSNTEVLDQYYGFREINGLKQEIEASLSSRSPDIIKKNFVKVYNQIREMLRVSDQTFRDLICDKKLNSMVRQFQVIFLCFYELIIKENMVISDYDQLLEELDSITKEMDIYSGRTWSSQNKARNIKKVRALIRECFKKADSSDPATDKWVTEFETLLTQSKTENALYDFKQGFLEMNPNERNKKISDQSFKKIIKTLTAMANSSPASVGYVCVGVADNEKDAQKIVDLYGVEICNYKEFQITGIDHEANILGCSLDELSKKIIQKIDDEPIQQFVKDKIGREFKLINYSGKTIAIFSLGKISEPAHYNGDFYQRLSANINKIKPGELRKLFDRFAGR